MSARVRTVSTILAIVAILLVTLTAAPGVVGLAHADDDFAAAIREAAGRYPDESARLAVGDAFLRFESSALDGQIKAADPARYRDLEVRWLALAGAMKSGAPAADVRAQAAALADILDAASRPDTAAGSSSLFVDAFVIIVREGFDALLILTALAAYLVKVGQPGKRVLIYAGGGAAVLASLGLAVVAEHVLRIGGPAREALEGVTMLVAVVVLFAASYWLISKSEARRWQAFVRTRLEGALGTGQARSLVLLAFLVVFREGFETVLFYEALAGRAAGNPLALSAVASGLALGIGVLGVIGVALFRYGVRVPIRPFFAATGILLYVLAFKFAGAGVRELQEAGWVSVTPVRLPELPLLRDWLAVYPFAEPLAAQALLIAALVGGATYALLARGMRFGGAEAARPVNARRLAVLVGGAVVVAGIGAALRLRPAGALPAENLPPEMAGRVNPRAGDLAAVSEGVALFQGNCASCHGERGDGHGAAATGLTPPPANFRGTDVLARHSDAYLFYRLTEGKPGTAMPSFRGALAENERWAVIAYLRSLTPDAAPAR